ncbi:MAG TPA: hypothetical protein VJN70_06555 [Gemmatimonadaceae bacterium]|nr:hypothetical protein [Gemmatimonadaceae bacterium]
MSDLRLRARSVTEIVDAAFQLYKRDALEYVLMAAVPYAPLIVAQLVFFRGTSFGTAAQITTASTTGQIVVLVVSVLAYTLMSAVLIRFSSEVYLERPIALSEVIQSVAKLVPRLIGAGILLALVVTLGFIPLIVGTLLTNGLFIFLGFLIAFVWIFYAVARYFAIFQLIVIENRGIMEAFTRSSTLSKDRKGHILLTFFLIFLIFWLLSLAVGVIALLSAALMAGSAVTVVAQTLYTVIAYPLIGITQMILYYDARIRAEGFDIEVMAGSLGAPPATSIT